MENIESVSEEPGRENKGTWAISGRFRLVQQNPQFLIASTDIHMTP
jgi:hypothetical protein